MTITKQSTTKPCTYLIYGYLVNHRIKIVQRNWQHFWEAYHIWKQLKTSTSISPGSKTSYKLVLRCLSPKWIAALSPERQRSIFLVYESGSNWLHFTNDINHKVAWQPQPNLTVTTSSRVLYGQEKFWRSKSKINHNIEMKMLSFWWNFRHWLHWFSLVSKWQLPM